MTIRPPRLRRSWLFMPGADAGALAAAASCHADVLIQELEDFTAPERRPQARALMAQTMAAWKAAGKVAAIRINPLVTGDGPADLQAALASGCDVLMIPKVRGPQDVAALDRAIGAQRAIEIVPNIESAAALVQLGAIATASARVSGCLLASEDLTTDLGAIRQRGGGELDYARQRFLVECVAAGIVAVDCPYTWSDEEGCAKEARRAAQWGFKAKSGVDASHADAINAAFTPSRAEIEQARGLIAAFEQARASGQGRAVYQGTLVEVPIYRNAQRLLERADDLGLA